MGHCGHRSDRSRFPSRDRRTLRHFPQRALFHRVRLASRVRLCRSAAACPLARRRNPELRRQCLAVALAGRHCGGCPDPVDGRAGAFVRRKQDGIDCLGSCRRDGAGFGRNDDDADNRNIRTALLDRLRLSCLPGADTQRAPNVFVGRLCRGHRDGDQIRYRDLAHCTGRRHRHDRCTQSLSLGLHCG